LGDNGKEGLRTNTQNKRPGLFFVAHARRAKMEPLSRSEFVHFVVEKLSQFPEEQQEGAQRWTFDEQKFLLRKGATDFSLSAPFEKYSALTDKSAQDEYFKNLVDVIRWIAKGNSVELNFDSIKDKLFPTIRMTIYYDAINKTYSPEDQRVCPFAPKFC
jgi:hypothetical protein